MNSYASDWLSMVNTILGEATARKKLPDHFCDNVFPPSNIYIDDKGSVNVELACAGYDPKDIEVDYKDNYIFISSSVGRTDDKNQWLQRGIKQSEFKVKYFLDKSYDESTIRAKSSNGILTITVDKRPEKKPKSIKIDLS